MGSKFLTSDIYRYSPGQSRYAESAQSRGTSEGFFGNTVLIWFYSKKHHIHGSSAHFSSLLCSLRNTSTKNSLLGTRQDTRKVKKTLELTIQRIAEAVVDVENLNALSYKKVLTHHILVVIWHAVQLSNCERSLATGWVVRRRRSQTTTVVSLCIQISSK